MRRLRVGVVDLIGNRPTPGLWNRVMKPNFASIMPQVVAVWCEEARARRGVRLSTPTSTTSTRAARRTPTCCSSAPSPTRPRRAAAISSLYRAAGRGHRPSAGPHARCYPQDAARYFDYVLGFTDKADPRRGAPRLRAAPPAGPDPVREEAASASARRAGALEVHRATIAEGPGGEDRAHDRQPRVPVHVQLLHRLPGGLPAPAPATRSRRTSASCSRSCSGRAWGGTIRTSASASTRRWPRSRRPCRRAPSTSPPRAASRSSRSRT